MVKFNISHKVPAIPFGYDGWKGNEVRILCDNCRCMHRSFHIRYRKIVIGKPRRQDMKMRTTLSIWCKPQDLLWCYSVRAHLHRNDIFASKNILELYFWCRLWYSQENSAVVIFLQKNCRGFFICPANKERNYQNENQKTTMFNAIDNYDYRYNNILCC